MKMNLSSIAAKNKKVAPLLPKRRNEKLVNDFMIRPSKPSKA